MAQLGPGRIKEAVTPLPPITDRSFQSHFDFLSSSRVVLIGDASHGTSEFYYARAEITKHLITKGFKTVALEADWPDAECIDRYVRQRPGPRTGLDKGESTGDAFQRFPTWMWRNAEMQEFVHWLRDYNSNLPPNERVGVYGLDLYSLGASMYAVIRYLDSVDPELAQVARRRYACLEPWLEEPSDYGLAHRMMKDFESCEHHVMAMLKDLLKMRLEYSSIHGDGEEFHSAEQNARLIADAEYYYRSIYRADTSSWNLRDSHMFETLKRLLTFRGGKAVVWAHNSHCGDARHTGMKYRGELNIGQLCRTEWKDDVAIVGTGTHTGTVAAADHWDGDMQVMNVKPSRKDSWERQAHDTGIPSFVLDIHDEEKVDDELYEYLCENKLERFIGVIYRPDTERASHYNEASLGRQFDAFVWFDETSAVKPLEKKQPHTPMVFGETYPFGL
ncbi:putative erythromycin esterase [Xylogone sp. PMI_703]|nr:putative erythromycin esterase [Xylogone sp. PMI_703]